MLNIYTIYSILYNVSVRLRHTVVLVSIKHTKANWSIVDTHHYKQTIRYSILNFQKSTNIIKQGILQRWSNKKIGTQCVCRLGRSDWLEISSS